MDFSYDYASQGDAFVGVLYLIYTLFSGGFGIAAYVLRSLSIYAIAKRRGIRNPWFSWFPVVDYYLLGCVSDQYRYVVKGEIKNKRKWLLGLSIAMWAVYAVMIGFLVAGMVQSIAGGLDAVAPDTLMGPVLGMMGMMIPLMGLVVAVMVIRYMALYDLYVSCAPKNAVMFLVLSIVFNVTEPFFLFFNRKLDGGMPPRKSRTAAESVVEPVVEIPHPVEETDPWDRPDSE